MSWFYYSTKTLVKILLVLLTRYQVNGKENVPGQGPLLVVANHLNLADPPLVGASLKRQAKFMAKEELFHSRFSSYLIACLGAFPVHRGKLDRKAIRQAEKALSSGWALVMFPEGRRSKDAKLQSALPGSTLIALRSGAPILPLAITGTEKIKGLTWLLRRPQITVTIGPTFYLPSANSKRRKPELSELSNLIMRHIAELLPPKYQGIYEGKKVK